MEERLRAICEKLKKEEKKKFLIAYGYLDDELHGYLSSYPQNVKIWGASVDDSVISELKKDFEIWKYKEGKKGVFCKTYIPFLSLDGCMAQAELHGDRASIDDIIIKDSGSKPFIQANISFTSGSFTGPINTKGIVGLNEDKDFESLISMAIRQAYKQRGYGRFPIHNTEYGEAVEIKELREIYKKKRDKD